jgi:hypothetical protein
MMGWYITCGKAKLWAKLQGESSGWLAVPIRRLHRTSRILACRAQRWSYRVNKKNSNILQHHIMKLHATCTYGQTISSQLKETATNQKTTCSVSGVTTVTSQNFIITTGNKWTNITKPLLMIITALNEVTAQHLTAVMWFTGKHLI